MPGTNLTREEAATRAGLLEATSYTIDLDLTTGDKTFASTTTLRFTCNEPGAETFADLVGAIIHEITLNGEPVDEASNYQDSRIRLTNLQAENELVVRADCAYSHSGEGLHRFVDPVDGRVYLYTQFEVPDARRVFTTFEQPDLKSVYTWTVVAPEDWKVVSNAPTPTPEPIEGGKARWSFPESKRMSTYVTALVAGEYYEHLDSYDGKNGPISLGHYCRQSVVEHLDTDALLLITKQGFEFFEEAFDFPYPFEKYDHLYVPEYNAGAMENAGAVTLRDEYLPRSRQDSAFYEFRCSVILHEMAHMWFGDLVTMRWWDDLWLNESFAEWACYHAAVENTEYTESWTGFTNARKNWALRQDQLPSTHPIAADNYDLRAVEVNFDGITYAKGASVLKQLVAWVGIEEFLDGLRQYFKDHAYANAEFVDLLTALEKSSGRELDAWAKEWLQTSGVNTLSPEFELTADGSYATFGVRQTAAGDNRTLRRHRLGIGLYDEQNGHLVRRRNVEIDIEGELSTVEELVGERQPDLLLLNDGDLTYAKIRLDERSLSTVVHGLRRLDDSLARALCWGAAWDMTRDAEMAASDYVTLVLQNIGSETDAFGIRAIPGYAVARGQPVLRPDQAIRAARDVGGRPARPAPRRRPRQQRPADLLPPVRRGPRQRREQGRDRRAARRLPLDRRPRHRHRHAVDAARRPREVRCGRRRRDRRRARPRPDHLRPGERRGRARLTSRRGREGRRLDRAGGEPRRAQRDASLDREHVHALRPGGAARAVRREVPPGGRHRLGRARHPHGLEPARGRVPAPAGQPRADRPGGPLARGVAGDPGGQAVRARGPG